MLVRHAFVVPALLFASAATAWAAPVRKAGEWQTSINGGQPILTCVPNDMPVDEQSIMQSMSRIPGADCKMTKFTASGDTIEYAMECSIAGNKMSSTGTITMIDPDTFTTKSHTQGVVIPTANGQSKAMPDMDMTIALHRTGPCKPGDQQLKK
jgi:hypothetical protein